METNKPSLYFFRNQIHFLKDNFIIHDEELFQKFNASVEQFCYFTLEMDKIIDGDYNYEHLFKIGKNTPYYAVKSHQESIKVLANLFPDNHEFWNYLDKNNSQYYHILLKEKYNAIQRPAFTLADFEEYAVGKHTLAYIPIIGLDFIFDPKHDIKRLKDVFTLIFKGIQMNDDVEDFQTDIQNNQWTYARSRAEEFIKENNLCNDANLDRFEERVLYVSGIAEELIRYSKNCFMQAKNMAMENNFEALTKWLEETIADLNKNQELILNLTKNQ